VWTANDQASLRREDSGEFQRHGHIVVDGYAEVSAWLAALAPPLTDEQPNLHGRGRKFDLPLLIATMARRVYAAGGAGSSGHAAPRAAATIFTGCRARRVTLRTRAIVLATGGLQADPRFGAACRRRRPAAAREPVFPRRRAGLCPLGASTNFANKGFTATCSPKAPVAPLEFIAFALYHWRGRCSTMLAAVRR
jgi:hypothetical protein